MPGNQEDYFCTFLYTFYCFFERLGIFCIMGAGVRGQTVARQSRRSAGPRATPRSDAAVAVAAAVAAVAPAAKLRTAAAAPSAGIRAAC